MNPLEFRKDDKSKRTKLKADHMCFSGYVFDVLDSVAHIYPTATKVDFVVESKSGIFGELKRLHETLEDSLRFVGRPELALLIGELIPGGKDRLPLQAADVLCWYSQRSDLETLEGIDVQRWQALAERPGHRHFWTKGDVEEMFSLKP
jgi:hypothetical protein